MTASRNWPALALWLMLTVSAIWVACVLVGNYGSCRANEFGQLTCFVVTLFLSFVEIFIFVIGTAVKIIVSILP